MPKILPLRSFYHPDSVLIEIWSLLCVISVVYSRWLALCLQNKVTTPLRRTLRVSVLITYPVSSSVGTSRTMGRFSVGWLKHWCFPPLVHITLSSFKKFSLLPLLPPLVNGPLENHEWAGWRTKDMQHGFEIPHATNWATGGPPFTGI